MAEERTGNSGKKKRAMMIVAVVVAVGVIAALFITRYRKTHISTDDAFIEGNIHTVAARVNGTVRSVLVSDNQPVKKGDLLVEIDPTDYDMRLREASSTLSAEHAKVSEAETRIAAAAAQLELQRANLKLAEIDKTRMESLYKQEAVPKDRYDKATTGYDVAQARVKAAEEQLRQAQSLKATQTALVRQKEAAVALAKLNTGYTKITAPVDGYITKKSVQVGNQIQAGQPLMALVSLKDLWVVANYKETDMGTIRPGQPVRIEVDSFPDRTFRGKVDSIMAGTGVSFSLFPAENATGNYVKVVQRIPVKIVFEPGEDKNHALRVGMSVVPTVITR